MPVSDFENNKFFLIKQGGDIYRLAIATNTSAIV